MQWKEDAFQMLVSLLLLLFFLLVCHLNSPRQLQLEVKHSERTMIISQPQKSTHAAISPHTHLHYIQHQSCTDIASTLFAQHMKYRTNTLRLAHTLIKIQPMRKRLVKLCDGWGMLTSWKYLCTWPIIINGPVRDALIVTVFARKIFF